VRYYINKVGEEKINGPYTVEQLNRSIDQGEIGSKWLATSDIGETHHMCGQSVVEFGLAMGFRGARSRWSCSATDQQAGTR
jgi:hypothetical protein